jgi:hypothetical protein
MHHQALSVTGSSSPGVKCVMNSGENVSNGDHYPKYYVQKLFTAKHSLKYYGRISFCAITTKKYAGKNE